MHQIYFINTLIYELQQPKEHEGWKGWISNPFTSVQFIPLGLYCYYTMEPWARPNCFWWKTTIPMPANQPIWVRAVFLAVVEVFWPMMFAALCVWRTGLDGGLQQLSGPESTTSVKEQKQHVFCVCAPETNWQDLRSPPRNKPPWLHPPLLHYISDLPPSSALVFLIVISCICLSQVSC